MNYHYVYRITDMKREKYYIGSRTSTLKPEEDLGHIYFSSSPNKKFIEEQKTFPKNFIYEIIEIFDNKKQAEEYERELIKQLNASSDKNYYNGRTTLEFESVTSNVTNHTLSYLGDLIKLARKERGISQEELAERIHSSRSKINRIEAGNAKVSIGTVFEACFVLGIPLMGCNKKHIYNLSQMLSYLNRLIPDGIPNKNITLNDNF